MLYTRLNFLKHFWMSFHATEPIYGTLCLYHRERREKLSEDFHFRCLPSEFQDVSVNLDFSFLFNAAASVVYCIAIAF